MELVAMIRAECAICGRPSAALEAVKPGETLAMARTRCLREWAYLGWLCEAKRALCPGCQMKLN